jgi:hypothetical protein
MKNEYIILSELKLRYHFGDISVGGSITLKLTLKRNKMSRCGVGLTGWGEDTVAKSCEHGTESLGFIKQCGELDCLGDPWS